ncbi:hypothetical protein WDZ17_12995 [Pseudokineococcus basanitobsidens]|uniref:Uncharacterized protein n=1 Tax=Pseudokineococcus basanitobsidens TaxID=1926649 RepID=A0ABU8RM85_9ACTN
MADADIWDRIRTARDFSLDAEKEERQRIGDAGSAEEQQAASVRLATRQAVREALDKVLDEDTSPPGA